MLLVSPPLPDPSILLMYLRCGVLCSLKTAVIHAWALQRWASRNGALYKSSFLYLSFPLFDFSKHLVFSQFLGSWGSCWVPVIKPWRQFRLWRCNWIVLIASEQLYDDDDDKHKLHNLLHWLLTTYSIEWCWVLNWLPTMSPYNAPG